MAGGFSGVACATLLNALLLNKRWLLLPLALATTPALAQTCVLTGSVVGLGNKPVVFEYKSHGVSHADTVRAVQDRFTYTAKPSYDG